MLSLPIKKKNQKTKSLMLHHVPIKKKKNKISHAPSCDISWHLHLTTGIMLKRISKKSHKIQVDEENRL